MFLAGLARESLASRLSSIRPGRDTSSCNFWPAHLTSAPTWRGTAVWNDAALGESDPRIDSPRPSSAIREGPPIVFRP